MRAPKLVARSILAHSVLLGSLLLAAPAVAQDSDGDGLLDSEEVGSGDFASRQVLGPRPAGSIEIRAGDLDGDSDADLAWFGHTSDETAWFGEWVENLNGSGSFGPPAALVAPADLVRGLIDLDGDLDVDALITRSDGTLGWYANDGLGAFGALHTIATLPASVAAASVDIDDDGNFDVYAPGHGWYENADGQGTFGAVQPLADHRLRLERFDLDGDQDGDHVETRRGEFFGHTVHWQENLGGGSFGPDNDIEPSLVGGEGRFTIAPDLDGDGDSDVVVMADPDDYGGGVHWYRNVDGNGTFAFGGELATFALGEFPSAIVAVDVEGDGDLDLIPAMDRHDGNGDRLLWYENEDGNGGSWDTTRPIAPLGEEAEGIAVADLDGDGDVDVFTVGADGQLGWYRQKNHSDPFDPDSDDDGLSDGEEVNVHGTDPLSPDSDGDGLGDFEEVNQHGTDPNDADPDGDGLDDPDELAAGTDPFDADSDDDGWSDGQEVALGGDALDGGIYPVLIDWVPVDQAGNPADATGFGAVAAPYVVAKHEITNRQYVSFLNSVAATDTHGLFHDDGDPRNGILRTGSPGSYRYVPVVGREGQPVTFVSLYDAMRFANWLHHRRPVGAQDATTTEDGAYTLTPPAIAANSVSRNPGALYALPNEDEWYKAAYYRASVAEYRAYPTTGSLPTSCEAPSSGEDLANCDDAVGTPTDVGAYTQSASFYGTFDQGGNVAEWTDSVAGADRRVRGGAYDSLQPELSSALSGVALDPHHESATVGFRLPEPGRFASLASGVLALLALARRRAR